MTIFVFVTDILDIIECQTEALAPHHVNYSHNCHDDANCTNTKGSFFCTCHHGYSGEGVICTGKKVSFISQDSIWASLKMNDI